MSDIPPSLHAAVVLRAGPDSGEEVPFSIRGRKTVAIHPPMSW
jgi:hypothetical protein